MNTYKDIKYTLFFKDRENIIKIIELNYFNSADIELFFKKGNLEDD